MTIRIVLADEEPLIRAAFRSLIDAEEDLAVVGEAADGAEALTQTRSTRADVVLMDIRMPGMDGLAATRAITSDDDLAGVKVIILTRFEIDDYLIQAVRAGASGFIGKAAEPAELLEAIRVVAAGDALLSPKATRAVIAAYASQPDLASETSAATLNSLTAREREIMALVAMGLSNNEIAERLYISPLTAKTHVNRAMMKIGARDRAQMVVTAYQTGLVGPATPPPEPL